MAGKKEASELVPALRRLEVTKLQRLDAVATWLAAWQWSTIRRSTS